MNSSDFIQVDQALLQTLLEFGFDKTVAEKAISANKKESIDDIVNWILAYESKFQVLFNNCKDGDIQESLPKKKTKLNGGKTRASEESVSMIMAMGFERRDAEKALVFCQNDVENAVNMLLSGEEIPEVEEEEFDAGLEKEQTAPNTDVIYRLKGFVSHTGNSTNYGHYVCHAVRNKQWIIFNDSKVAQSLNPPKTHGYIYLYERC